MRKEIYLRQASRPSRHASELSAGERVQFPIAPESWLTHLTGTGLRTCRTAAGLQLLAVQLVQCIVLNHGSWTGFLRACALGIESLTAQHDAVLVRMHELYQSDSPRASLSAHCSSSHAFASTHLPPEDEKTLAVRLWLASGVSEPCLALPLCIHSRSSS